MNPQSFFQNLKRTIGTRLSNMSPGGFLLLLAGVFFGLILFGRLILLLAILGGAGWLVWKLRWTLLNCFERVRLTIEQHEANSRRKYRNRHTSSANANPFRTSAEYRPGPGSASRNGGLLEYKPGGRGNRP